MTSHCALFHSPFSVVMTLPAAFHTVSALRSSAISSVRVMTRLTSLPLSLSSSREVGCITGLTDDQTLTVFRLVQPKNALSPAVAASWIVTQYSLVMPRNALLPILETRLRSIL